MTVRAPPAEGEADGSAGRDRGWQGLVVGEGRLEEAAGVCPQTWRS